MTERATVNGKQKQQNVHTLRAGKTCRSIWLQLRLIRTNSFY